MRVSVNTGSGGRPFVHPDKLIRLRASLAQTAQRKTYRDHPAGAANARATTESQQPPGAALGFHPAYRGDTPGPHAKKVLKMRKQLLHLHDLAGGSKPLSHQQTHRVNTLKRTLAKPGHVPGHPNEVIHRNKRTGAVTVSRQGPGKPGSAVATTSGGTGNSKPSRKPSNTQQQNGASLIANLAYALHARTFQRHLRRLNGQMSGAPIGR